MQRNNNNQLLIFSGSEHSGKRLSLNISSSFVPPANLYITVPLWHFYEKVATLLVMIDIPLLDVLE